MTSMHIERTPVILGLAGLFGILYRKLFSLLKGQGKVSNMTVTMILRGRCWNTTESAKAYQETVGLKSTLSLLRLKPSICLMFWVSGLLTHRDGTKPEGHHGWRQHVH